MALGEAASRARVRGRSRRSYRGASIEARRQDQYFRLIKAGRDAFAEHGFAGASIEDIVSRARVSRTSFYRFFSDKERCLLAVFRQGTEVGFAAIEKIVATELSREERMRAGVRTYFELLASDPAMARVTLIDVVGATPAAERARVEARERFAKIIEEGLREGPWKGKPELEVRLVAFATMAAVGEVAAHLITTGRLGEWRDMIEPLAAYTIRATGPPAEEKRRAATTNSKPRLTKERSK